MPRRRRSLALLALALLLGASSGCHARAGWGRGSYKVLREVPDLQIRRSKIRLDPQTGELVMAWAGARVPVTVAGEMTSCRLLVWHDRDRNGVAATEEVLVERWAPQPCVKVLFDDVRVRPVSPQERILARIDAEGPVRQRGAQWTFDPD